MMVNIHDVEKSDLPEGDKLEAMFDRQRELMEKYHEIEKSNGLLQTEDIPVNINDAFGQARLKDFAWRITEELGEAMEAMDKHSEIPEHAKEEIADALHFLIEFTILTGETSRFISFCTPRPETEDTVDNLDYLFSISAIKHEDCFGVYSIGEWVALVVRYLSQACNCLKNKPWKQSHMLTDAQVFYQNLLKTWVSFIALCLALEMGSEKLFALYFGKSDVNKFRQRSNY